MIFLRSIVISAVALSALLAAPAAAQVCTAPQVMLIVDKSSSMLHPLPDGSSKWDAANLAIRDLTSSLDESVDFGVLMFPMPNRCEPGQVVLPIGSNTAMDVAASLGEPPPEGGNWTPMAESIDAAASDPQLTATGRTSHAVLITDGWQWCDDPIPYERFAPVDAVGRLTDSGVTVHIVGFGAQVDSLTLNRAAVRAGTDLAGCDVTLSDPAGTNHCYHQANDTSGLRAILETIGRTITEETCNGIDDDCDDTVDEGFDQDADGYTICGSDPSMPGTPPDPGRSDCDDADMEVNPGATEICNDKDDDCDGTTDPGCACTDGASQSCGNDEGVCEAGMQACTGGVWSECMGGTTGGAETCDDTDQDCDGTIDEGDLCPDDLTCFYGVCVDLNVPVDGGMPPGDGPLIPQEGGCGCTTPGPATIPMTLGLLLGLALVLSRRRRRS